MGKSQRRKGAEFEREVAKIFSDHFGREFERNIGQARDGGNDIDAGRLVVECKRRAFLRTLRGWLEQATAAAASRPPGAVRIAVMREDGAREPMVLLGLRDFLDLADWNCCEDSTAPDRGQAALPGDSLASRTASR